MKNQKNPSNILGLFILIIFCAGIFAGCGESYDGANFSNKQSLNESGGEYYDVAEAEIAADYDAGGGMLSLTSASANLPADRKIIRDANVTMEVENVETSYDNMLKLLATFNGYEANRNMYDNGNKNMTINATLKIPADKLDTFLEGIKKEGELISSNITSADITDQYFDSQTRLTTLEKTLQNYYEFLENAQDVDEQLRVTRYINDITQEIEQLKGSLKRWDSLVDYSTITINLYRPYEAPKPERVIEWNSLSIKDMGWFISSGFLGVVNAIFSVLQWLVIGIITASPIIIPVVIIIILLVRHQKKDKKNKKDKYAQYNNTNQINNADNTAKSGE